MLTLLATSVPVSAYAAEPRSAGYEYFEQIAHRYSRSRDGYSSAVEREIKKLGSKAVEEMPIPVLMGIGVRNLSKNFGDARDGGSRSHEGLDIMAPMGALVASPTKAVVTRTGEGGSAGIYVYTAGPGGETFAYMHLSGIAPGVKSGTVLEKGDLIGYVGDTGNAKGGAPHLHFEIRKDRRVTDPYPRLTREFTVEERIAALTELLASLQKELARAK